MASSALRMTKKKVASYASLLAWVGAVGLGLYAVSAHGAAAGRAVSAPWSSAALPTQVRAPGTTQASLVLVAHPACPCTRASLHQLARIVGDRSASSEVDVVILFTGSGATRRDRVAEDLRAIAASIPGARVVDDFGGAIARGIGAYTSGSVVFYDASGRLRFSGGITPSRGHEGDSGGADTIRDLVREAQRASRVATPRAAERVFAPTSSPSPSSSSIPANAAVFGCGLEADSK